MGRNVSRWGTILPTLAIIGTGSEDVFSLSYSLARARYQRAMQLFGWEPFLVSHHPAKFGGYASGSGDIMVLISHVISQNYITQEPCCVLVKVSRGKSPPCQIWKSKTLWWWRCNRFRLSRDLTRPRDQKFMWFITKNPSRLCQVWWP